MVNELSVEFLARLIEERKQLNVSPMVFLNAALREYVDFVLKFNLKRSLFKLFYRAVYGHADVTQLLS